MMRKVSDISFGNCCFIVTYFSLIGQLAKTLSVQLFYYFYSLYLRYMMRKVSDKSLLVLIHSVVVNVTYFSLIRTVNVLTLSVQLYHSKNNIELEYV